MKPSTTTTAKSLSQRIRTSLALGVFWLGVWQLVYWLLGRPVLVPSPWSVAARLWQLVQQQSFWSALLTSCLRVGAGLLLALLVGTVMGLLSARFPLVATVFRPVLRVVGSTPVASFIILALIWITSTRIPIFISFLMVLPLVWNNLYQGMLHIDPQLEEMVRLFGVSRKKRWQGLYLPSLLPYLSAALTTGVGFAWKAGIAAEIIALPQRSIGEKIHSAKVYLETTDLFAWTIAIILISLLLEKISLWLLGRLTHKIGGPR